MVGSRIIAARCACLIISASSSGSVTEPSAMLTTLSPRSSPHFVESAVFMASSRSVLCADDLIRTQLEVGQLAERRLKRADKLGLQLTVKLVAAVFLLHVPAHVGVEEQRDLRSYRSIRRSSAPKRLSPVRSSNRPRGTGWG